MLLDLFSLEYSSNTLDTHDGFKKYRYDDSKEKTKALLAKEQQKLADRELLRRQLLKARHGDKYHISEVVDNINNKLPEGASAYANKNNIIPTLKIAIQILDRELSSIHHQIAIGNRFLREEDDIYTLLLTIH